MNKNVFFLSGDRDLKKLNGHSFKFQGNFVDPVGTGLALVALKEAQPEKTPGWCTATSPVGGKFYTL